MKNTILVYVSMDWKAGILIYKHGVYTDDKNEHTCALGHFSSFAHTQSTRRCLFTQKGQMSSVKIRRDGGANLPHYN